MIDSGTHCCSEMEKHLSSGEVSIVYTARYREYGISTRWEYNRSAAKQLIYYCPWCGTKLPENLRDVWFNLIEEMGLEPDDEAVPEDMKSDDWWSKKGL